MGEAATDGSGNRSRHKLDLRTRTEALRLARRGQAHPHPEVSLKAYQWASDRLRVSPLMRELLIVVAGGLVGVAIVVAVVLGLDLRTPPLSLVVVTVLGMLAGCCGWTVYMHRRVEDVARLNRPDRADDA